MCWTRGVFADVRAAWGRVEGLGKAALASSAGQQVGSVVYGCVCVVCGVWDVWVMDDAYVGCHVHLP